MEARRRWQRRHGAADLDVVRADPVLGPAELVAPVHGHVRADPIDLRPIFTSRRARSCTWLAAALGDRRRPGGQRGRHQRALGAHDRGLVHEDRARLQAAAGGMDLDLRSPSTAPRSSASRWGSRRRRPMKSPPGGGIRASPNRARSGPASRKEADLRRAPRRGRSGDGVGPQRQPVPAQSALTPSCRAPRPGPRCRGSEATLPSTTSSSVSRQAARIGRAAFLLPAAGSRRASGARLLITNLHRRGG